MSKLTTAYEDLLIEYENCVEVHERCGMINKGLYSDGIAYIKKELTETEKACILAEEQGHYETSSGDILDTHDILSQRQERRARIWAHGRLLPISKLILCYEAGCHNRYEISEYLGVSEEFLEEAIAVNIKIHGHFKIVGSYCIYFEPLGVMKLL